MSGYDMLSSHQYTPPNVSREFLEAVERELKRRLGQEVKLTLGIITLTVEVQSKLGLGSSAGEMALDWLLYRKRPEDWADILERKIKGEETFGHLSDRAEDVEHLMDRLLASPSPAETGRIALENVEQYDDQFFEAFDEVIARDKAYLRLDRVPKLELLRKYLVFVRTLADAGMQERMRQSLIAGTFLEEAKRQSHEQPRRGYEQVRRRRRRRPSPTWIYVLMTNRLRELFTRNKSVTRKPRSLTVGSHESNAAVVSQAAHVDSDGSYDGAIAALKRRYDELSRKQRTAEVRAERKLLGTQIQMLEAQRDDLRARKRSTPGSAERAAKGREGPAGDSYGAKITALKLRYAALSRGQRTAEVRAELKQLDEQIQMLEAQREGKHNRRA